jgi:sec-independent protein translocase protein TatA
LPFQVGPAELIVVLVVALLVLGPKRLPEVGRSLGNAIREFKSSISGEDEEAPSHSLQASETTELSPRSPAELHKEGVGDRVARP